MNMAHFLQNKVDGKVFLLIVCFGNSIMVPIAQRSKMRLNSLSRIDERFLASQSTTKWTRLKSFCDTQMVQHKTQQKRRDCYRQ